MLFQLDCTAWDFKKGEFTYNQSDSAEGPTKPKPNGIKKTKRDKQILDFEKHKCFVRNVPYVKTELGKPKHSLHLAVSRGS